MSSFLFITDLDNTLVGDDQAMAELNTHLHAQRQTNGTKIVYSTGRSRTSYQQLFATKAMLEPDLLILAVGTEIYHGNDDPKPDAAWSEHLSDGWSRREIVAATAHYADLKPQPDSEQRPFKVSYFLTEQAAAEVLPLLETTLRDRGLDVQLVYSGGKDLDILPRRANKGQAMGFIRERLGIGAAQTVACGDSGNDLSMFADREERGVIVGNAMPELRQWHDANPCANRYLAKAHCAGGILEGLQHFGFL